MDDAYWFNKCGLPTVWEPFLQWCDAHQDWVDPDWEETDGIAGDDWDLAAPARPALPWGAEVHSRTHFQVERRTG
jgi:hypothetical protein